MTRTRKAATLMHSYRGGETGAEVREAQVPTVSQGPILRTHPNALSAKIPLRKDAMAYSTSTATNATRPNKIPSSP